MKRRSYEPNTKALLRIPTSSRPDTSRGKRVKVVDIGVDNPLNFKFDASSIPVGVKTTLKSDDAKTSEYAFFKKLKEDAGQKFASHVVHGEPNRSDELGCRDTSRARENNNFVNNNGHKNVRSSLLVENATPVKFISFNSPLASASETRRSTSEDVRQKEKDREEYSRFLRPEGTRHRHAEVFNRKRQKLRRWVTDVSFPEIDGLCSKGYDVVPVLLSRLIPESKDNNNAKDLKFGQVDTDAKFALGAYPESDIYCKKLQWIPTKHLTDPEFGPYLGDYEAMPHNWPNRTRGKILCLGAPYSLDNNTQDWYRVWESDSELLGGNRALCTERDSGFSFPFRRFRFIEPVEELDHLTLPNRYLFGNQSNTPMLGWDYDKEGERNSFPTFHDYIERNAHPTSLVPWIDSNKHNASEFFSLSNVHADGESRSLLPISPISSYHNQEYGVHVLEDKEDVLLDSNHFPLTLSCRDNYLGPPKDYYNETGFQHQDHWFMNKIFSQGHHHNSQTECLFSPGLVLNFGWKCFPISGFPQERYSSTYRALEYPTNQSLESFLDDSNHKGRPAGFSEESEGNVSIHEWSSSCFQISLDRDQAFPLIVDR